MEFELLKDILILFIVNVGSNFHTQWPIIYPYLGSYLKEYNDAITLKQVFSSLILVFLGTFIGNSILPRVFFILGVKKTLQLGSILYFINLVCYYSFTSTAMFYFNMIWTGIIAQFVNFTVTYFFSEKYTNGVFYSSYATLGLAVSGFVWPVIISKIINPENKTMEAVTTSGGIQERYYGPEVSFRIIRYLNINGLTTMIINVLLCQLLKNPKNSTSKVSLWISAVVSRDRSKSQNLKKEFNEFQELMDKDIKESLRTSNINVSTKQPVPHYETELLESKASNPEPMKKEGFVSAEEQMDIEIKKEMKSLRFWSLCLVATIRGGAIGYFVNNFNYIAGFIVKNDALSSAAFSFTAITNVVGRLAGPMLWQKYDFLPTYTFIIASSLVINITIILFGLQSPMIYLALIFFARFVGGIGGAVHSITLFSLYGPDRAIHLFKIYDMVSLVALLYAVALNYLCTDNNSFTFIFTIFAMIEVVGLVVMHKILN